MGEKLVDGDHSRQENYEEVRNLPPGLLKIVGRLSLGKDAHGERLALLRHTVSGNLTLFQGVRKALIEPQPAQLSSPPATFVTE